MQKHLMQRPALDTSYLMLIFKVYFISTRYIKTYATVRGKEAYQSGFSRVREGMN